MSTGAYRTCWRITQLPHPRRRSVQIPIILHLDGFNIDARAVPMDEARIKETVFISKWVDYSNKYGLGYQLTDGSVGVLFNDGTKMILAPDQMFEARLSSSSLK